VLNVSKTLSFWWLIAITSSTFLVFATTSNGAIDAFAKTRHNIREE
jgi:hypothetical protein